MKPSREQAPARLVLVCAEDQARLLWREQLELRGWLVIDAPDIRVAIDASMREQPHVIVAATPLPDVSGYHFVRTLRGVVEHDIKIIGVRGDGESPTQLGAAGFDQIVEHPIDFDSLHRFIANDEHDDDESRPTIQMKPLKP